MATGQELLEDKKFLASQGYGYAELSKDRARATWYRPDGLAIPSLPTDMYHRTLYRKRGWTLSRPEYPVVVDAVPRVRDAPSWVERAEALGIKELAPPPRHIHVMQPEIGSPCLVLGCPHVRLSEKVTVSKRNPRSKKEKANAR